MKLSGALARQRVGPVGPLGIWGLARMSLALSAAIILVGCTEKLDSSAGCPIACIDPQTQVITDTLTAAVTLDATIGASPGIGTETLMLLASRGDSLDTRLIFRFDTIPPTIASTGDTITTIDSTYLHFTFDSTADSVKAPVTLSLYDVDSTGLVDDTSAAILATLFTPARLLGSRTLAAGKAVDTISVPLSNAIVLSKVRAGKKLRIGVRVTSTQSVSLRQPSVEATGGIRLSMRVSADTSIPVDTLLPTSKLVGANYLDALALRDFMIVVRGTPPVPAGLFAVGGLPTKRAYLRFTLPTTLVDSSIVVRATLLLTQFGNATPDANDSMLVRPFIGAATSTLLDPEHAGKVTSTLVAFDSLLTHPATNGVQEIEIAPAFGVWALQSDTTLPRAIVLESGQEFLSPQQALFYSSSAVNTAVRPRIRITYTPRKRIGTP